MKSKSAEAWGYALLLTRRVLTTALAGATEDQLHQVTPLGSLADCASEACAAEAGLIWPEDSGAGAARSARRRRCKSCTRWCGTGR